MCLGQAEEEATFPLYLLCPSLLSSGLGRPLQPTLPAAPDVVEGAGVFSVPPNPQMVAALEIQSVINCGKFENSTVGNSN